jgi:hypothetical protein
MVKQTLFGIPRIRTDFNAVRPDRTVVASLRFADAFVVIEPKTEVLLYDGEGNSVSGLVRSVSGLAVSVIPDWASWRAADSERLSKSLAAEAGRLLQVA